MITDIKGLDREEALRYLGYQGTPIPKQLQTVIQKCIDDTLQIIHPRYLYHRFPLSFCDKGILLQGTGVILEGNLIREHLSNCREVFVLCVTLGAQLDRLIRMKMLSAPEEGVILDACGSAAVEHAADFAEQELSALAAREHLNLTWRFSPGYGDLPIHCQKELLDAVDAQRKIGLTVNQTMMLIPCKSVTAVLGITDTRRDPRSNKCDFCNNRLNCAFRKRGTQC